MARALAAGTGSSPAKAAWAGTGEVKTAAASATTEPMLANNLLDMTDPLHDAGPAEM